MIQKSNSGRTGDKKMQKRKNRWYIAVAAVVILAVVLVLAVVLGKKGKNKKDPKMIEPTQQEQASEIPTETEEVFDYSATETAETKSLPKSVVSKQGIQRFPVSAYSSFQKQSKFIIDHFFAPL